MLIVGPEDLNQVSWLWFLIVLFQQMVTKICSFGHSVHLKKQQQIWQSLHIASWR